MVPLPWPRRSLYQHGEHGLDHLAGFEGNPNLIGYAETNGAIHTLTKSLATSLVEQGIRVNCVAPGPVWTPLQVTAYFGVLNFPWIIKPLYGLVSDFVPLFGYRRTSYLIVASIAAAVSYTAIALLDRPLHRRCLCRSRR